jgi:hypothetical protein
VVSYLTPPIRGGTNPFGSGVGGRVGTSFGPLYVGANIVNYLGGTDVDLHARSLLWGGEVGYTFRRAWSGGPTLVVRPAVGAGAAMLFYTVPTTTTSTSNANAAAHPIVDMVSTASHRTTTVPSSGASTIGSTSGAGSTGTSTPSGSTSTGATGTSSTPAETIVTTTSETTAETSLYIQPSVTVMATWSWCFVAVKASAVVIPVVADGLGGDATWLTYGVEGQVGLLF